MKIWLKFALVRALKTFCQSLLATLGVAAAFNEINWLAALSTAALATLLSLLTSVVTSLPEVEMANDALEENNDVI